jgi:hypothetical protein
MFADRINSPRHDAALEANGCSLERWEQPLSDLAARADAGTVVILAEPKYESTAASKRSLLVDARGVPLSIAVSGANTHDVKLLAKTLEAAVCERPKPRKWKPQHLCADAGYFASANSHPYRATPI